MTRNIKQIFGDACGSIYFLSDQDKRFIGSFGTSEKPISLGEFLMFWNSLTEDEKQSIMLDYQSEEHPGMDGFKG